MTQRSLVKLFLGTAILSNFCLGACSAKVSGASDSVPPLHSESFDNKIAGPSVEGLWSSACLPDYDQFRQIKVTFQGQNISRISNEYSDSACTQIKHKSELKGLFRWTEKTAYGGFALDYRFDLGGGVTQITGEEILIENATLYLSDFKIGFASIDKTFPLVKDGTPNPLPNPTPGPTPVASDSDPSTVTGMKAQSWEKAKYAFCSVQGLAVLLDFQNQDLSQIQSGSIKVSVRECGSKRAFQANDPIPFVLSKNGRFKMTLDDGYSGFIEDDGKGLTNANAIVSGNSGLCTFLENKGVKDIFGAEFGSFACD